jgi:hypothetical protein
VIARVPSGTNWVRGARRTSSSIHPAVSAAVTELADTMAGEEQFEFGLDLILDGLEARRGPSS